MGMTKYDYSPKDILEANKINEIQDCIIENEQNIDAVNNKLKNYGSEFKYKGYYDPSNDLNQAILNSSKIGDVLCVLSSVTIDNYTPNSFSGILIPMDVNQQQEKAFIVLDVSQLNKLPFLKVGMEVNIGYEEMTWTLSISNIAVVSGSIILTLLDDYGSGFFSSVSSDTIVVTISSAHSTLAVNSGDFIVKTESGWTYLEKKEDIDLSRYQEKLTFDTIPKANSNNPVTSGGIYNALNNLGNLSFGGCLTVEMKNHMYGAGLPINIIYIWTDEGAKEKWQFQQVPETGCNVTISTTGLLTTTDENLKLILGMGRIIYLDNLSQYFVVEKSYDSYNGETWTKVHQLKRLNSDNTTSEVSLTEELITTCKCYQDYFHVSKGDMLLRTNTGLINLSSPMV